MTVYFVKLNGTAENNFAKSKQRRGKLDVFPVVNSWFFNLRTDKDACPYKFLFYLLAVDRVFRPFFI